MDLLCHAIFYDYNWHGMVVDVTCILGVVTGRVGIVIGMGNCCRRVPRLESLWVIVVLIILGVVDVKFVIGVFVVIEVSMALGRIPFHMLIVIIIAMFPLSSLSRHG